jgi:hypothetical protein
MAAVPESAYGNSFVIRSRETRASAAHEQ